jgi:dihydroorotate dehydrogenase
MIRLANGHELDFVVASGALNFTGNGYWWEQPFRWLGFIRPDEFTIITKTLTFHPRKGNLRWWAPWRCVRLIKGGTHNAVGLTNPGFRYWIDRYYPVTRSYGYKIIVSISPDSVDEAIEMAGVLSTLQVCGIEVNPSCPNVAHYAGAVDLVNAVVANTHHPVIVKLGYTSYKEICPQLDGKVAAFDLINAVPWGHIFGSQPSPLAHFGGGAISGDPIIIHSRDALEWGKKNLKTPIISGGGINTYEEAMARFNMGADAISFGTLFLRRPWRPNRIVARCKEAIYRQYAI